jgi:hypothetical protein
MRLPAGAAAEIVIGGENGFVPDEPEMARAIDDMGAIDPARCRASAAARYDIRVTATRDVRVYCHVI